MLNSLGALVRPTAFIVFALSSLCFAAMPASGGQTLDWQHFRTDLPLYPISSVGKKIDASQINRWFGWGYRCPNRPGQPFSSFPAKLDKGEVTRRAEAAAKGEPPPSQSRKFPADDPKYDLCDDGDMTLYNGLLCAVGFEDGCNAVQQAQGNHGQWFRSPDRVFWSEHRCPLGQDDKDGKKGLGDVFCEKCANSFSDDMALGTSLYLLAKKRTGVSKTQFDRWSAWMEKNSATTQICFGDPKSGLQPGKNTCFRADWPRFCTDDMGCKVTGGKFKGPDSKGLGMYAGACMLLPNVSHDFDLLGGSIGRNWGTHMRLAIAENQALRDALSPAPVLAIGSSGVAPDTFVLHLDAVRVLIRMIVLNPDLKSSNLPPRPQITRLLASPPGSQQWTVDPIVLQTWAQTIYQKGKWNPFYRLLANGPTPGVRGQIMDYCDKPGKPKGYEWLWMAPGTVGSGNGMGYDCAFIGALYNKMLVKADLWKELADLFEKELDPTRQILTLAKAAAGRIAADLESARKAVKVVHDKAQELVKLQNDLPGQQQLVQAAQSAAATADAAVTSAVKNVVNAGRPIHCRLSGKFPDCKAYDKAKALIDDAAKNALNAANVVKALAEVNKRITALQAEGLDAQAALADKELARLEGDAKKAQAALSSASAKYDTLTAYLTRWKSSEE